VRIGYSRETARQANVILAYDNRSFYLLRRWKQFALFL